MYLQTVTTLAVVIITMHIRNVHSALRSNRNGRYNSIHTAGIDEVHDVPIGVLIRPFEPALEERKVLSLMQTLKVKKKRINTNNI